MRRIAIALLLALCPAPALAQSSPNLQYGQVPTAAQWNSYFAAKQDYPGAASLPIGGGTLTGKLTTVAPATGAAGFNLPIGVAPSSPVPGDMWSTASGLFYQSSSAVTVPITPATMVRVSADFSVPSSTTLANVPGLAVSLAAATTYSFHCPLFFSTGAAAGGIKFALSGTATITNLIADAQTVDGTTAIAGTQVSAFGSNIAANTNAGTTPKAVIEGTITVNAAGTITVQFAQNASSATPSVVKRGSYCTFQVNP